MNTPARQDSSIQSGWLADRVGGHMKHIVILFAAALVLQACAPPPQRPVSASSTPAFSDNLAAVIADIQSIAGRTSAGELSAARTLPHNINVLTRAIERGQADAQGVLILRYYRGVARQTLSELNRALGFPPDRPTAEAALADFEIIANDRNPESQDLAKDALYLAGQVVTHELGDPVRGLTYFQRCAEMKQAGCQAVVASAKIGGALGMRKDTAGAVALHQEIYATGLDYGCVGSFSAYSLARLTHFTGAVAEDHTALDWLRRAVRLADQAKVRSSGVDHCGGDFMSVYEYLIRLEARDRKPVLLEQAKGGDENPTGIVADLLGYLDGSVRETVYRQSVADQRNEDSRCQFAFLGLWHAAASNQMTAARAYRDILRQHGNNLTCAENLVFAGKYLR